jgi:tellurium resistance protein TerZ
MTVNMSKGQKISLAKADGSSLTRVLMGLGWDVAKGKGRFFGGGGSIDLDASCLLFDAAGVLKDQVWFRQLRSSDGSVQHTGDNVTGAGDGDDESIKVDLSSVPAGIDSLVFTVSSFTGQTFDKVENAFCRLVDETSGDEIARYTLSERGAHTAIVIAKLYRHQGTWKMAAIGENTSGRTFKDMMPVISQYVG